jgi:ABC-type glycerol-3-phosphate transport system permease component
MVLLCLVMALPVIHIIAKSLSSKSAVVGGRVLFWPVELNFANYQSLFANGTLPHAFMVTVFITIVGTALNIFFTTMMAYPLAKRDLRGRSIIMYLVVFTMVFSAQ